MFTPEFLLLNVNNVRERVFNWLDKRKRQLNDLTFLLFYLFVYLFFVLDCIRDLGCPINVVFEEGKKCDKLGFKNYAEGPKDCR